MEEDELGIYEVEVFDPADFGVDRRESDGLSLEEEMERLDEYL